MALIIGTSTQSETGHGVLARSRARAALIPDLLIEAQRIANTVTSGWHGRRRRGPGDAFWQFRPYDSGESLSRIDWRRSARDENALYVRDQEWEAAHTVWVWADNSPSMLYQSENATVSKQSRALVLALALCEVLARSGERVGWPGLTRPLANRDAAERIAASLSLPSGHGDGNAPALADIRPRSEIVLVSDFLQPVEQTLAEMDAIAQQQVRGSLLQIVDPAEEVFPFRGRTEFVDPESGNRITFGRAEMLEADYRNRFAARQEALERHCRRLGWNHVVHHTDQLASAALAKLHLLLSQGGAA